MPTVPLARSDVIHLHTQLTAASKRKLDLYLPSADPTDTLKTRVQSHVDDFIGELFGALDGNVTVIDGNEQTQSLKEIIENKQLVQTEPFDFNLAEQVRKLWVQVEEETVKLTKLRKNGPADVTKAYEDSFNEVLETVLQKEKELEEDDEDDDINEEQKLERLEDVKQTYQDAIETILKMKENIPDQRNELVKIEKVANFLSEK